VLVAEDCVSLCPHGYTAIFDCPICECPGCARPQDACVCHLEQRDTAPAERQVSNDELLAQFAELLLKVNAARFEA
jgi:hypothetical protein